MTAAVLTGRPNPALMNDLTIPIYSIGYFFVFHVPFFYTLLRKLSFILEPILTMVDALTRAIAMTGGLDTFRNHHHPTYAALARTAYIGQAMLGTISVTAGGIIYNWLNGIRPFQYPGWSFTVVAFASIVYVLGSNEWATGVVTQQLRPFRHSAKAVGVPAVFELQDWKLLCAIIIVVGFALNPTPAAPKPRKIVVKQTVVKTKSAVAAVPAAKVTTTVKEDLSD
ncbi:hypothetical protein HDV00_009882 [Rhizophlyctis rosea]|nr:hypothetical protein HDV00_009882 [Rhizophlyctis rosea]